MSIQPLVIQLPGKAYPVYFGQNLLLEPACFRPHLKGKQVFILSQPGVAEHYLEPLLKTLAAYRCDYFLLPVGEEYKTLSTWQSILEQLIQKGHERSTTLIALGGGMVGDLTGFAAATYLRGVNYLQVPTTLMAQVDSSVGGKTGINHAAGKNLIGAFYHPQAVLVDTKTLATLPEREYRSGLAEVVKYGLIADAAFFQWLETESQVLRQGKEPALLLEAIKRSLSIKAEIVAEDPLEQSGRRALLNFGHTLGHALEGLVGYGKLLHGEAVAIGMNCAARLSMERGWLAAQDYQRLQALLENLGFKLALPETLSLTDLLTFLNKDKKIKAGQWRFVLLKGLGEAVLVDDVQEADLAKLIPHL